MYLHNPDIFYLVSSAPLFLPTVCPAMRAVDAPALLATARAQAASAASASASAAGAGADSSSKGSGSGSGGVVGGADPTVIASSVMLSATAAVTNGANGAAGAVAVADAAASAAATVSLLSLINQLFTKPAAAKASADRESDTDSGTDSDNDEHDKREKAKKAHKKAKAAAAAAAAPGLPWFSSSLDAHMPLVRVLLAAYGATTSPADRLLSAILSRIQAIVMPAATGSPTSTAGAAESANSGALDVAFPSLFSLYTRKWGAAGRSTVARRAVASYIISTATAALAALVRKHCGGADDSDASRLPEGANAEAWHKAIAAATAADLAETAAAAAAAEAEALAAERAAVAQATGHGSYPFATAATLAPSAAVTAAAATATVGSFAAARIAATVVTDLAPALPAVVAARALALVAEASVLQSHVTSLDAQEVAVAATMAASLESAQRQEQRQNRPWLPGQESGDEELFPDVMWVDANVSSDLLAAGPPPALCNPDLLAKHNANAALTDDAGSSTGGASADLSVAAQLSGAVSLVSVSEDDAYGALSHGCRAAAGGLGGGHYDPAFVLPFYHSYLHHCSLDLYRLATSGVLGYVIRCCSLTAPRLRALAYACLARVMGLLQRLVARTARRRQASREKRERLSQWEKQDRERALRKKLRELNVNIDEYMAYGEDGTRKADEFDSDYDGNGDDNNNDGWDRRRHRRGRGGDGDDDDGGKRAGDDAGEAEVTGWGTGPYDEQGYLPTDSFADQAQLLTLLMVLRNTVTSPNQRLPNLATVFLAKSASVILAHHSPLCGAFNRFLLGKPALDTRKVQLFGALMHTNSLNYRHHHAFLFKYLHDAMICHEDAVVLARRRMWPALLSFADSPACDRATLVLLLRFLLRAVAVSPGAAYTLVQQHGVVAWLRGLADGSHPVLNSGGGGTEAALGASAAGPDGSANAVALAGSGSGSSSVAAAAAGAPGSLLALLGVSAPASTPATVAGTDSVVASADETVGSGVRGLSHTATEAAAIASTVLAQIAAAMLSHNAYLTARRLAGEQLDSDSDSNSDSSDADDDDASDSESDSESESESENRKRRRATARAAAAAPAAGGPVTVTSLQISAATALSLSAEAVTARVPPALPLSLHATVATFAANAAALATALAATDKASDASSTPRKLRQAREVADATRAPLVSLPWASALAAYLTAGLDGRRGAAGTGASALGQFAPYGHARGFCFTAAAATAAAAAASVAARDSVAAAAAAVVPAVPAAAPLPVRVLTALTAAFVSHCALWRPAPTPAHVLATAPVAAAASAAASARSLAAALAVGLNLCAAVTESASSVARTRTGDGESEARVAATAVARFVADASAAVASLSHYAHALLLACATSSATSSADGNGKSSSDVAVGGVSVGAALARLNRACRRSTATTAAAAAGAATGAATASAGGVRTLLLALMQ